MIIILILLAIIFITLTIIAIFVNIELGNFWKFLKIFSKFSFCIIFTLNIIIYAFYITKIPEYNAFKISIKNFENKNIFVFNRIIEINNSIGKAKYFNNTILDSFIPDDYAKLNFIELKRENKYKICFEKIYNPEFGFADKRIIEDFLNDNNIKEKDIIKIQYNTNGIFWILYKKKL